MHIQQRINVINWRGKREKKNEIKMTRMKKKNLIDKTWLEYMENAIIESYTEQKKFFFF